MAVNERNRFGSSAVAKNFNFNRLRARRGRDVDRMLIYRYRGGRRRIVAHHLTEIDAVGADDLLVAVVAHREAQGALAAGKSQAFGLLGRDQHGDDIARIPLGIRRGRMPASLLPMKRRSVTIGSFSTKPDLVYAPMTDDGFVIAPGGRLSRDQRTLLSELASRAVPIGRSLAATMILTDCAIACRTSASRRFKAE